MRHANGGGEIKLNSPISPCCWNTNRIPCLSFNMYDPSDWYRLSTALYSFPSMTRGRYTYANLSFSNCTFCIQSQWQWRYPKIYMFRHSFRWHAVQSTERLNSLQQPLASKSDTLIISPSAYGFSSILVTFVHDLTTVFPSEAMSLPSIKPLRTAMVVALPRMECSIIRV